MGFFADVKFLANLFRTKSGFEELVETFEKESIILEEQASKLRHDFFAKEENLSVLTKKQEELDESIENLKQNIEKQNDELHTLHSLDSIKFIRNLTSEKKCEMYKLDLTLEEIDEHYSHYYGKYCYEKGHILKIINSKIQEFAAIEGISYEKLKTVLYDINSAWFELYHDNIRSEIIRDSNITELLLTSFMMIRKKEEVDKITYKELKE